LASPGGLSFSSTTAMDQGDSTELPTLGTDPSTTRARVADHLVQFYEDERFLTARVADFLRDGLSAGDVITVIATEAHARTYQRELELRGFDGGGALAAGLLTFFDAHEILAKFMRDGEPDPRLFESTVGAIFEGQLAARPGVKLRAYGEMVDVLWQGGQRGAAIRLEELWNELQARHSFTLLCAYAVANFYKEPAELQRVCATHTHVMPNGEAETDPSATALPPQYARRLAKEIAQREEVEHALRQSLRELRAKDLALKDSDEQLRDFVENATLGLHRVGPDGTILWANQAELDLLGYAESEYVGHPISEFHADQSAIQEILARLRRGEALHDYEARLRARDGSIKHVLISSSAYSRDGGFVHTRCFTRDITERRRAEDALRRSERQLQLVTDALPTLVSYVDHEQVYRLVSASYERWFGRPRSEIIGRSLVEVLGEPAYAAIRPYVQRALAGEHVSFETEIPYPNGRPRYVEATYVPKAGDEEYPGGFVALVSDVTERKTLERFRAAAARRSERLSTITAAIADAVSAEQVFEALVDRVYEAMEADSAGLWLLAGDGRTAGLVRGVGYSDAARQKFETVPLEMTPSIPLLDSIRGGEPVWIRSQSELVERYPHLAGIVTQGRAYRVSCLPLVAHGRVIGALGLTLGRDGENQEDERDFLMLVARYASQAVERLRLFDAERRSRAVADEASRRMGVLSHASRVFMTADLDLEVRLRDIVSELGTVLSSAIGISLVRGDGLLHTAAAYHPVPEAQALLMELAVTSPLKFGEGVAGAVAVSGQSVLLEAISPEELLRRAAPSYRGFLERFPMYAMICSPLRVRGGIMGTVTATRTRASETYTPEDLQLFEELADRAAAAIDNARLHRSTMDAHERAEQLYRFAQAVVVADTIEAVFDAALSAIEVALGAKRAAVLTFDQEGVMRFVSWRNLSDEYRRAVEGHSPWPADAVAPQPLLIADARNEPSLASFVPLFEREGIGALGFVPLVTRGRLLGKFMVYYDVPHRFESHDIETALSIANHLASVMARFSAVSKLEETIRANELFAGVLAHDLRNPLGAITTAAQLLLMRYEGKNVVGNDEAKPLSRILSSSDRMTRMIDQLLDFTRARTGGGIQLTPRVSDLEDLCKDVLGEFELSHPEWKVDCAAVGDLVGTWDADRLLQVLSNLVGNAGQHGTLPGRISVRLDGSEPERVRFSVHNDGAIAEALIPQLFDPFRTPRQFRSRSGGLGLGLFIVRELVQTHGGTVHVSSSPAAGTTVAVDLPRHASVRPSQGAA
jgi:PAS domain S-box-containing protein